MKLSAHKDKEQQGQSRDTKKCNVPRHFWIRKFFFVASETFTSTRVPRTPLGILASEYASLGAQNLYLELRQNQLKNQRKMRRARLTPRRVRERTWERGCHLKYSIHGNELAAVVQKLDGAYGAIHRINLYPTDKYLRNQLRYPVDSDLCDG